MDSNGSRRRIANGPRSKARNTMKTQPRESIMAVRGTLPAIAYGLCRDCRNWIRLDHGTFKAHNWGMRLCPNSWQLASRREPLPFKGAA
jgi:hypothetical protein